MIVGVMEEGRQHPAELRIQLADQARFMPLKNVLRSPVQMQTTCKSKQVFVLSVGLT